MLQVVRSEHQEKVNRLIKGSQLSPRFLTATFENYFAEGIPERVAIKRQCQEYADNFEEHLTTGTWLTFMGDVGTGKGHLSAAIANQIMHNLSGSVLAMKLIDLVAKIKATWNRDSEKTEEQVIGVARSCDLLILDEIGLQFETNTERVLLYRVLDYRYEHLKPTILTTNLTTKELKKAIGAPLVDRLNQPPSQVMVFKAKAADWNSYRRQGK